MNRLKQLPTLRIDASEKLSFDYLGDIRQGMKGDTVATALYANGVRIFGRSLKYHRPRGLNSMDGESSNCFMEIDGIPNVRAETTLLKSGMSVRHQNIKKSSDSDLMGVMDKMDWAMPAGFYYRSMHKPAKLWPFFIKQIRKVAGQGSISPDFRMKGKYDDIYPTADVCVIGGGPAGMTAALTAAEQGLRVILLESRPWFGGFFDYRTSEYTADVPLYKQARELAEQVETTPGMRTFRHTAMIGAYSNNQITAFQTGGESDPFDERYIEIRAKSVVVATGCIERPLLFDNNERPGVMQVACAHRLARTYGLFPGEEVVFSVGHDLGIEAALDLSDLGLSVAYVADVREDGHAPHLLEGLAQRNIPFLRGWAAQTVHGSKRVEKVTLSTLSGSRHREHACDTLVASAGLTPLTGPLTLAQAKLAYDNHTGFFLPEKLPEKMYAAGRMLGLNDPLSIEASGKLAGLQAAADCGASVEDAITQAREELRECPGPVRGSKYTAGPVKGRKSFICFDEDATVKNISQAVDAGFDAPELIKRFTAAGTGPGQGGIPGHNLALLVSQWHTDSGLPIQPTTVRPPLVPTYIATYTGAKHDMCKRTPVHNSQEKAGGVMQRAGVWKRARRFSGDIRAREEVEHVRNHVGILDASTLGKFRIFGPDALKALQRVYAGDMSKVSDTKVKYAAMCNEDGCLIDDGVVVRQGENDYYFTTSTGRAGGTAEWIRYHTRYEDWHFSIVNLTDTFGVINLAGPDARKVLEMLTDADVSNDAFPFTGYREFTIRETIPVRAMRLGFVGELSFELHVPSSYMASLWDLIMVTGRPFGIRNFGLEAQSLLRLEKGHIIIGSESEQRTTLHDLGLSFLWHREKPEAKTVGAVALYQTEHQADRLKLVGFKMEDTSSRPPKDGSIIVDSTIRGYVCTARHSFSLNEAIGMAIVDAPLAEPETRLEIFEGENEEERLYAKVVSTPFYDPEGERLRM